MGNLNCRPEDPRTRRSLWFWSLSKMCQVEVNKFYFSRLFFSILSFFSFRWFGIARKGRTTVSSEKRLSLKQ